jgi:hypothetical protein
MEKNTSNSAALHTSWEWLVTDSAQELLSELSSRREAGASDDELNRFVRGTVSDVARAAALLSQLDLRAKAEKKFGSLASSLLFTPAGLEQASRLETARSRAARFQTCGIAHVEDLGCGIAAEALALIQHGIDVRAVDIDPLTAKFAAFNLETASSVSALGAPQAGFSVECADVTQLAPHGAAVGSQQAASRDHSHDSGVLFDPARRSAGHKNTTRVGPADYSPPLDFVFSSIYHRSGAVKLGPAFAHNSIPEATEAQWTSVNGSVVELCVYSGALARPGITRAAQIFRDGQRYEMASADPDPHTEVRELSEYLYEPDGAVLRAQLLSELAQQTQAGVVSQHIAYLTSNQYFQTPFAQAFRVTEVLPAKEKTLKKALRARDIGALEIKKRGSDIDPMTLRKRLSLRGQKTATVIFTRLGQKHVAILAERVVPPENS